jgi:hypothetical protein
MTTRIALLLASLFVSGVVSAQSQQAIRDQFFGETDAVKAEADALNAEMLAPVTYADGMEYYGSAGDTLEKGKDMERVREDVAEAKGYFERAIEAAKLAQLTFANALTAREAAQKAEAAQYAARDWTSAEEDLVEAAEVLEGGNLKRAGDLASDVEEAYREVEASAINAKAKANN